MRTCPAKRATFTGQQVKPSPIKPAKRVKGRGSISAKGSRMTSWGNWVITRREEVLKWNVVLECCCRDQSTPPLGLSPLSRSVHHKATDWSDWKPLWKIHTENRNGGVVVKSESILPAVICSAVRRLATSSRDGCSGSRRIVLERNAFPGLLSSCAWGRGSASCSPAAASAWNAII